jgi:NAD(P)-dependent dehydrogenase (short-subunit alcohol dehydrogenase family)
MTTITDLLHPAPGLRVLVTGGGGGIGRRIAEGFIAAGASVHVSDVDAAAVADFVAQGPNRFGAICDARDIPATDAFYAGAMDALGGLDIAIANAGIAGPTGPVDGIDTEGWDSTLEICLRATWRLAHLSAPQLRVNAGLFIGISSAAGRFGFPNRTPYAAAKWGVVGLVKSLAMELGPHGARANAILPGVVDGPRQNRVIAARAQAEGRSEAEVREGLVARTSMRRMVTQDEIAGAILYLASPMGSAISGQAIAVDAGLEVL